MSNNNRYTTFYEETAKSNDCESYVIEYYPGISMLIFKIRTATTLEEGSRMNLTLTDEEIEYINERIAKKD